MIIYSGFNGFGQWPPDDYLINNFTPLDLQTYGINNGSIDVIDFYIGWAYNVINIHSKFIIKGFLQGNPNQSVKLITPNETSFTNLSCSEKYILFYNTANKIVWKYSLSNDIEGKWCMLPNFINTEQCDSETPLANDENVKKIVCGSMINIALSSEGRLFNIPSEISITHVIGKIIDISCGHEHGIALTDQGNVYTWGGGSRCQLGHGSTESLDTPELIQGLAGIKIVKISSGGWHSCAISSIGDLYTWGWNDRGQLGIYSDDTSLESTDLKTTSCDNLTTNVKSQGPCLEAAHSTLINSSDDKEQNKDIQKKPQTPMNCSFIQDKHLEVFFEEIDDSKDTCNLPPDINLPNSHFHIKKVDDIRIKDNVKRKKFDMKNSDGRNFTPLSNYAIPMLIDIYDHECNIVSLNITDVACGSKHTLIKLEDNSIWGSGCNKYGQLGFGTDSIQEALSFKRLDVTVKGGTIYCGTWASMIKELHS